MSNTAWTVIRQWAAPRLLGRRFEDASEVAAVLEEDFRGHQMAKGAVEMGFWGLEAEIRGIPLAELVGGTRQKIATGISLGIQQTPATLVDRCRAALRSG